MKQRVRSVSSLWLLGLTLVGTAGAIVLLLRIENGQLFTAAGSSAQCKPATLVEDYRRYEKVVGGSFTSGGYDTKNYAYECVSRQLDKSKTVRTAGDVKPEHYLPAMKRVHKKAVAEIAKACKARLKFSVSSGGSERVIDPGIDTGAFTCPDQDCVPNWQADPVCVSQQVSVPAPTLENERLYSNTINPFRSTNRYFILDSCLAAQGKCQCEQQCQGLVGDPSSAPPADNPPSTLPTTTP